MPHRHLFKLLRDRRFLIVDDDSPLASFLETKFRRFGAASELLGSFRALTQRGPQLAALPFDVVITDFDLGGGETGLDVVRWWQSRVGAAAPPCILLTGNRQAAEEALPPGESLDHYFAGVVERRGSAADVFQQLVAVIAASITPREIAANT